MLHNLTIDVRPAETGVRLDRLIQLRFPDASRALVLDAIECGAVRVNGQPARKGGRVTAGERIAIAELATQADVRVVPNPDLPLNVVYEDAALMALDKPAGQPVHPLSFRENGTLANALLARHSELAAIGGQPLMPSVLHRIDTGTSGLVLAARTESAYADLRGQFSRQTVRKVYLAVVHGTVKEGGRVESLLAHRGGEQHRMAAFEDGAPARRRGLRAVTAYAQ